MLKDYHYKKSFTLHQLYPLFLLPFFLLVASCNAINSKNIDKKILKHQGLSTGKHAVVKYDVINEDKAMLIMYKTITLGAPTPRYLDGEYYYLAATINNKVVFFDETNPNLNAQILKNIKANITRQENIDKINKYFDDYKSGRLLVK